MSENNAQRLERDLQASQAGNTKMQTVTQENRTLS